MGPRATFFAIFILVSGLAAGLLTGCTGLVSSTSSSTPPSSSSPTAPGNSPAAASVTQYLYTADGGSRTVSGFKINSDGTLATVPGSPFAVGGAIIPGTPALVRAADGALLVGDPPLWAFTVDANTGAIQKSDETTPGPVDLAVNPQSSLVYQITADPGFSRGVAIYQVSGGKFQFRSDFGTPVVGKKLALDPQGKFIFLGAVSQLGRPPGIHLDGMKLSADGTPGSPLVPIKAMCGGAADDTLNSMTATAGASHMVVFATCSGATNLVEYFVVDNTGMLVSSGDVTSSGAPQRAMTDASGTFLFVANAGANTVDVYAIDAASGALSSAPVQQQAVGASPNAIAFDSTGKFMYVANSGSNNISAFSFNGTALQPIGTFPAGQAPVSVAVVKP
jgi:DNA-binding beta-propeller fold protein YncE